jgi:hypothetical protein
MNSLDFFGRFGAHLGCGWCRLDLRHRVGVAASNCSVSTFLFRRACSARKARPRSLVESAWQNA